MNPTQFEKFIMDNTSVGAVKMEPEEDKSTAPLVPVGVENCTVAPAGPTEQEKDESSVPSAPQVVESCTAAPLGPADDEASKAAAAAAAAAEAEGSVPVVPDPNLPRETRGEEIPDGSVPVVPNPNLSQEAQGEKDSPAPQKEELSDTHGSVGSKGDHAADDAQSEALSLASWSVIGGTTGKEKVTVNPVVDIPPPGGFREEQVDFSRDRESDPDVEDVGPVPDAQSNSLLTTLVGMEVERLASAKAPPANIRREYSPSADPSTGSSAPHGKSVTFDSQTKVVDLLRRGINAAEEYQERRGQRRQASPKTPEVRGATPKSGPSAPRPRPPAGDPIPPGPLQTPIQRRLPQSDHSVKQVGPSPAPEKAWEEEGDEEGGRGGRRRWQIGMRPEHNWASYTAPDDYLNDSWKL